MLPLDRFICILLSESLSFLPNEALNRIKHGSTAVHVDVRPSSVFIAHMKPRERGHREII